MPDKFSKETRSKIMSRILSKNTKPEIVVRKALRGLYFRHQPSGIPGNPDFALKNKKIAIFIDGCFWHKCPKHFRAPKSNKTYWNSKIKRNVKRAKEVEIKLERTGWGVIRFWEHEALKNSRQCAIKVMRHLNK